MLDSFPGLFVILTRKNYEGMFWSAPGSDPKLADLAWVDAHVREGHGPLGAAYPRSGWDPRSPGVQEGDSPSFLHLVSGLRGLNDPEKPDQGGWGGRFVRPDPTRNHWFDDPEGPRTVWRWRADYQGELATRIGWSSPEPPARHRLVVLSDIEADPDDTPSQPPSSAGGSGGATMRGSSSRTRAEKCRVLNVRKTSALWRAAPRRCRAS